MDVLTLLRAAEASGLTITVEADRVWIRGPKAAEPIVRELMAKKALVIQELTETIAPNTETQDSETAELVTWILEDGQHLIPDEPFHLGRFIRITNPARFKEHLLYQISLGPDGFHYRRGYLARDLRWLKKVLPEAELLPDTQGEHKERRAIMTENGGLSMEEVNMQALNELKGN